MTRLLNDWNNMRQYARIGRMSMADVRRDARNIIRDNLSPSTPRYNYRERLPLRYRHGDLHDLRWTINNRLNGNQAEMVSRIKAYKDSQRVLGVELGIAIREADVEMALELINNASNIRDRRLGSFLRLLDQHFSDEGGFYSCSDCNTIGVEEDGSYAYEDTWVCQSCIDDNYTYSENRGTFITNDDYAEEEEEEEDEDNGVIGSYHHSKRHVCHIPSKYDKIDTPPVLLGLELEMECHEDYNRYEKAQFLHDMIHTYDGADRSYPYAFFEEDGSLNYGFEMVTSYTGLDVHAEQLKLFKDNPVRGLRSHDTQSCGLHVHVSRAGMTTFHACKLAFFIHDSGNQRLLRALARRSNSRHAKMVNKKADSQWIKNAKRDGISRLNDDRYEAINFQNDKTVEFRLFKGTLRYESIMACLEFSYNAWFFSRDAGVTELTEAKFLEFICQPSRLKHSHFLREYLRSKNFSLPVTDKQPKQEVVEV